MSNERRKGVCVRWGGKGFGFLQDTSVEVGKEFFCHISYVEGRIGLEPGARVEFEVSPSASKSGAPQAMLVTVIPSKNGGGRE
jgi:cold shock CspA family protein